MRLAGPVGAVAGALLLGGCVETRRALGESCLKNTDCLSGICSQLRCDVLPPLTDTRLISDAAAGDGAFPPPLHGDAGVGGAGPDAEADAAAATVEPSDDAEAGAEGASPGANDTGATDVDGSDTGESGAQAGAE
ncbi:MAG: hypothetical protein JOZ69_01525 [Myxococcales bacterium]|nr:hypothetical protein [Myxococcales bacterium]